MIPVNQNLDLWDDQESDRIKIIKLDDFEERAAIMEFDGGLTRELAEKLAREDIERGEGI